MAKSTRHGKQGRIDRARIRRLNATHYASAPWQKPCCPECEKVAQQAEALRDFTDIREGLTLSENQARMYWAWVTELSTKYVEADEILDGVSITITFTPMGRTVVAHTVHVDARGGAHCTLEDFG